MIQRIKLSNLSPNSGQIEGLPANPRLIKDDKFEKLKKSLQDDPEMLELRELLVFKWEDEYVIIGGNMRYRAAVDLGIEVLPCKIMCLDLFGGSGTTMVAAHQLGRNCYMMEYDPHYCEVIIDRMLKLDAGLNIKKIT